MKLTIYFNYFPREEDFSNIQLFVPESVLQAYANTKGVSNTHQQALHIRARDDEA